MCCSTSNLNKKETATEKRNMRPFAAGRSPGASAPQHEQLIPSNNETVNNYSRGIDRGISSTPDRNSIDETRDGTIAAMSMPPPPKRPRLYSGALTAKRKVEPNVANHGSRYPVRDPSGLLLLSFPLKLHLILQRCEGESIIRRNNFKQQKTGDGRAGGKSKKNNGYLAVSGRKNTDMMDTGTTTTTTTTTDINNYSNNDEILIGWLSSGKAFKIYDEERFVREIMPSYFFERGNNSASFETVVRNLDLWGFSRMACVEGPTTRRVHVCSHPSFVKGRPSACRNMKFRIQSN